ncbi:unnamed protein product [Heligmosomoides polygyrus]|uniref:Secreted protein n=1 Tax=Heligmosomoides polygyrus TaxID=6339 RepID=A0A183G9B2_HELPZ|nr:unnamed protein product [Heligmosomoides polygyrus]
MLSLNAVLVLVAIVHRVRPASQIPTWDVTRPVSRLQYDAVDYDDDDDDDLLPDSHRIWRQERSQFPVRL